MGKIAVIGLGLIGGSLALELKKVTNRHLLHAGSIEFTHPASGEIMKITSEIPDDFNKFIGVLGDHE